MLEGVDPSNFRKREWRAICRRARIGHRALKDLRDTFASQLLTAGVQLGYVSMQLGHADLQVTTRHYARWCGGDDYRQPMALEPGEVPADLLARIAPELPTSSPQRETAEGSVSEKPSTASELGWSGKRDSNPRPSAWEETTNPRKNADLRSRHRRAAEQRGTERHRIRQTAPRRHQGRWAYRPGPRLRGSHLASVPPAQRGPPMRPNHAEKAPVGASPRPPATPTVPPAHR